MLIKCGSCLVGAYTTWTALCWFILYEPLNFIKGSPEARLETMQTVVGVFLRRRQANPAVHLWCIRPRIKIAKRHVQNVPSSSEDTFIKLQTFQTFGTTYLLTYLLTPCSRVLLEQLTSSQLTKNFPPFYGTRRFITAFTSARNLSLSRASSIQSIPLQPTS